MKEKCPGTGDWAVDDYKWHPTKDHTYWCVGCGSWRRIPQRGRMVGLVPYHKRDVSLRANAPYETVSL